MSAALTTPLVVVLSVRVVRAICARFANRICGKYKQKISVTYNLTELNLTNRCVSQDFGR